MKRRHTLQITKSCQFTNKTQLNLSHRTITMLSNDDVGNSFQAHPLGIGHNPILLRTVDKQHHISILLNSSRLSQIGQHRLLRIPRSQLHPTVQLGQSNYRNIQFLSNNLQLTWNQTHLLLAVSPHIRPCRHQL